MPVPVSFVKETGVGVKGSLLASVSLELLRVVVAADAGAVVERKSEGSENGNGKLGLSGGAVVGVAKKRRGMGRCLCMYELGGGKQGVGAVTAHFGCGFPGDIEVRVDEGWVGVSR